MRIGIFVSDTGGERTGVEELQQRARWVEEQGFTSAWVPHIPWSLDGLTALVLAAQVTDHIELGTAVMPTYPRHPLAMAQQALSVQAACSGRLALAWRELPPRRIALLRMPRLAIVFHFEGVDEAERQAFMRYFDLYTQRGGG